MALQIPGNPGSPLRVMAIHLKLFHHKLFDDRFGIWTSAMAGEGRVKEGSELGFSTPKQTDFLGAEVLTLARVSKSPGGLVKPDRWVPAQEV